MTKPLTIGYPVDPTIDFPWPDLYLNPHLKDIIPSVQNDPSFQSSYNKQKSFENQARSSSFLEPSLLNEPAACVVEKGFYDILTDIANLKTLFEPHIETVFNAESRNTFYAYDRSMSFKSETKECQAVNKLFSQLYLNAAAGQFFGLRNMSVKNVVLHVAKHDDVHFNQVLGDLKYKPKTQAMHFDPKAGVMKAIVYLNDVDRESGPFMCIPESHRWLMSDTQRISAKANCTYNYMDTEEKRIKFRALPEANQYTSIFGSVCADEDPVSQFLLEKEIAFLSEYSNIILFPASCVVHRGGMPTNPNKYRINLQVSIK